MQAKLGAEIYANLPPANSSLYLAMSDLSYTIRTLVKNPGFTTVSVLTLALGIGANTVIFSIFDGVLLKPLGFRDPSRLVAVQETVPRFAKIAPQLPVNADHFGKWRRHNHAFEQLAMIGYATFNLTSEGEPQRVPAARVSPAMFLLLGVSPQIGRAFDESEDQPGHDRVVLISDGLWTRLFHRDPAVVGRKVILDGSPFEVVGVLPPKPRVPSASSLYSLLQTDVAPEMWKPFAITNNELSPFGDFNYGCIGRLRPGVTLTQAAADLDAIQNDIASALGANVSLRISLTPLQQQITGASRNSLVMLLAAVGAVLLIVCVNVASLMLIRATGRQREIAIRTALGAGSARLLRQVLAEAFVLSGCGAILGTAAAYAVLGVALRTAPLSLPRIDEIQIDARVLAFTLIVSVVTAMLFGLLPAWRFARTDPNDALKSSGRALTESRQGGRVRSLLVGVEVGLSVVTLIAAGLLLSSFVRLMGVDKGFQPEHAISGTLRFSAAQSTDDLRTRFLDTLLTRLHGLPGVTAVGVSNMLPLAGEGSNNNVMLEGESPDQRREPRIVDFRMISPDYFHALGLPVVAGRLFEDRDRPRKVVIVSSRTVQKLWPGENPIGKRFHLGSPQNPLLEVVGVVGDLRGVSLQSAPNPTVYLPYWQRSVFDLTLVARTPADPLSLAAALRQEIRQLDPQMPLPEFHTLQKMVDRSVAPRRFQMNLVLLFAAAALMLAALGVYGVVSYSVAQRTNEMGIRMVLGARARNVQWLVVRQGLLPVAGGLGAGLAIALALGRLLSGFLFGVKPADPLTFAAVIGLVAVVTAAGCYVPALRATRVDPATALRYE